MGIDEHKKDTVQTADIGILTLSSTRKKTEDKSGQWMAEAAMAMGHRIVIHEVLPDAADIIARTVTHTIEEYRPDILILTGGTGISPKDVTIEAVRPLFAKELTAFSVLFAQMSYMEIASAAILSRATAGILGKTAIFCIPGSKNACRMACEKIIFPEIGHLIKHMVE